MEIYRFNDLVGINPPMGPTWYLKSDEALQAAIALLQVAADIKANTFIESKVPPINLKVTGSRYE